MLAVRNSYMYLMMYADVTSIKIHINLEFCESFAGI